VPQRAFSIRETSQVGDARRGAVALAGELGFGEEDAGRVAIVATELATNLLKHGAGGELLVGVREGAVGSGVECLALDKGPGIVDIDAALRDGHSTTGTSGTGLGAIARGSHAFDIYSQPSLGTAVLARLYKGRPSRSAAEPAPFAGAVSLPKDGEDVCGDAWRLIPTGAGMKLMVADGLGHGPEAEMAARAAVETFAAGQDKRPKDILEQMHIALRRTRGAAVAIADIDLRDGAVVFAGIGNIAGVLISDSGARRMVSHNGTVGSVVKRVQEFTYPIVGEPLVVMWSDGLAAALSLEDYPGLLQRDPTLIAGVLYRDFNRERDDVTVVVARAISL
jgi:anti-sigma regulatory factor (Ser/Thr protein kinase)